MEWQDRGGGKWLLKVGGEILAHLYDNGNGKWHVVWSGREVVQNIGTLASAQRWTAHMVMVTHQNYAQVLHQWMKDTQ